MNERRNSEVDSKTGEATRSGTAETRPSLTLNEIQQRAYEKWESAGKPDGDATRFWLEAEKELLERK